MKHLGIVFFAAALSAAAIAPRANCQEAPQAPSAAPAPQGPQAPPYRATRPIAIVGGLLIDATGAQPRWDQTVVIEGERITAVGPMEAVTVPEGAEILDASGMTVMPGMINANAHVNMAGMFPAPTANLPIANLKARWERLWARMPRQAFIFLMQGITSFRNTSGPAKRLLEVKRAIDRGEIPGPRMFLGGGLFRSDVDFQIYARSTPRDAVQFMRDEFAFIVLKDIDKDTEPYIGAEFNYWKLRIGDKFDGQNDFTDEQIRTFIATAHKHGKKVDCHCGPDLRRMSQFDIDVIQHPFARTVLIEPDVIETLVKKGVIISTLFDSVANLVALSGDPHRFDEMLYATSIEPREYRILMTYRDRLLANLRTPERPGVSVYDSAHPPDFPGLVLPAESAERAPPYNMMQLAVRTSRENMKRFIKAGAKFSVGTDTNASLTFAQDDPHANEMMHFVEMGMTPMQAIEAATRNGAEALGMLRELGTIEKGKLGDVIVVAGNPLQNMAAMKRIAYVIKGGVRYK